jgi:hypothetical protein
MDALEWLNVELANAQAALEHAARLEERDGFPIERTIDRTYWWGYTDALSNVLNELYGPGDTN